MDYSRYDRVRAVAWTGEALRLLDQRKLPFTQGFIELDDSDAVAKAIHDLVVRGAPAIGIAAAWGVVLAARNLEAADGPAALVALEPAMQRLNASRPTAVNLAWALARLRAVLSRAGSDWYAVLTAEAEAIEAEDLAANRRMGGLGAALIEPGSGLLTHCNTGSLATSGFGTALGVVRAGVAEGRVARVFAGETRPWNQGARLTVWELLEDGIDATLIADSAAAHLMASGAVQWVVVGADRVTANGDVANKIGTLALALAARHFGVGFMVVAPSSTVDLDTASGADIEIEERDPAELLTHLGQRTVADGVKAWNPVFDVTPAELVSALVTERGVVLRPDADSMRRTFGA
ncbi:S-methyl-5-thioribose-1-phosphate isomerase [Pseudomarimonas salicorniae]|uniref:Methylthioribose-1-phosphate isomerase n=1 Tax=Pseudomarimonas salicorniae TaxID=2933270 RepID=A0ABT0GHY1_9GAMM|nr:S-methyl-5-thioribose-1-phosphate isomerase [Lysobacter sp. CAU 1642]MCK7594145.1 S-methyl-5-thioribose-1-phosphate isomerase [Lysobacter sp. CAU 1642]